MWKVGFTLTESSIRHCMEALGGRLTLAAELTDGRKVLAWGLSEPRLE